MNRVRTAFFLAALAGTAGVGRLAAQGFSPEDAVRRMKVPDDLEVKLVACEPDVRQPVTITFDDTGRMWVDSIPAISHARRPQGRSRWISTCAPSTTACRKPPPKGPKGADRITILSDPDENGHFRKAKDCIDGLNLASGMCLGYGGVFVLQTPYLLFYHFKDGHGRAGRRPRGAAERLRHGGRPRRRQLAAVGAGRLAVRRPGQHRHRPRPRPGVPAGDLAVSSDHQGIRAVRGGRRQYLGPRLRRPRQRHRRHQLGRLRHAAPGPGRLLHQGLRQARPAAQPAFLRLFRPRSLPEFQGRPRHLRRHRLPGRRPAGEVRERLHRRQPPFQLAHLVHLRPQGIDASPASRWATS